MSLASSLPALLGGPAVRPQGPPCWPLLDEEVLAALQTAFADSSWGKYHGGHVARLEERLGEEYSLHLPAARGSGTLAVEDALPALPIGPGGAVVPGAD